MELWGPLRVHPDLRECSVGQEGVGDLCRNSEFGRQTIRRKGIIWRETILCRWRDISSETREKPRLISFSQDTNDWQRLRNSVQILCEYKDFWNFSMCCIFSSWHLLHIWNLPVLPQDHKLSEGRKCVCLDWWCYHRVARCIALVSIAEIFANQLGLLLFSSSKSSETTFILYNKRIIYELDVMWELNKISYQYLIVSRRKCFSLWERGKEHHCKSKDLSSHCSLGFDLGHMT